MLQVKVKTTGIKQKSELEQDLVVLDLIFVGEP